ncbi:MAG: hypothetical protein DI568_16665 [Sphingomonas sp.]|nr:MAG: hypothetical protein DI568_16665 [Sphingomonas sp.]
MAERFTTYVGTYRFEGQEWSIRLQARTYAEAQERMRAMGLGRIDGELVAEAPLIDWRMLIFLTVTSVLFALVMMAVS